MKLGIVTYNIAKDWDLDTTVEICNAVGIRGVEFRTTHAHGVEVSLTAEERKQVKLKMADGGVEIVGLGSAFEYHAVEPEVVRENIDGTIEYAQLAADLGCTGVKVRPNGLQTDKGIPVEKTLEQIGLALRECGEAASKLGVEVRLEVHGRETSEPKHIRTIVDHADHDNVKVCWNCNQADVIGGSVKENFDLLKSKITLVHINELHKAEYPWREFFTLLKAEGFSGWTLAEIPDNPDPDRLLRYYKALWEAYTQ